MTFSKGDLQGELKQTQYERWSKSKRAYYWQPCLALLSESGDWLTTERWYLSQKRKAATSLIKDGWHVTE